MWNRLSPPGCSATKAKGAVRLSVVVLERRCVVTSSVDGAQPAQRRGRIAEIPQCTPTSAGGVFGEDVIGIVIRHVEDRDPAPLHRPLRIEQRSERSHPAE